MKRMLRPLIIIIATFLLVALKTNAQENFAGSYKYEVRNTPSGDYFGVLTLRRAGEKYEGEFVNDKGKTYPINCLKVKGNKMLFTSNIEDTENSMISCMFVGDSVRATIEVKGDSFLYKLSGKKQKTKTP